jgi:hypothetical protein
MAKLTKSMLRNLIMETLDEELDEGGRATGTGADRFDTGTTAPLGRSAAAPRVGVAGEAESARLDFSELDPSDRTLELWDKVATLEAKVADLDAGDPTAKLTFDDVPEPARVAPTVKSRVAESRRRRRKRKR